MFNAAFDTAACRSDENLIICELIHKRNKLREAGENAEELDALLEAVKLQRRGQKKKLCPKRRRWLRELFKNLIRPLPSGRIHSRFI